MRKRFFVFITLLLSTIVSHSQTKGIEGSWTWTDSLLSVQFLIKANGTIEKRTAVASEDVWSKTPQKGTYKFKKEHNLNITWADKSIENIDVKFIGKNAEFKYIDQRTNKSKTYIFLRIVDEEIIPDK